MDLSLEELKQYLAVDSDEDDTLIGTLRTAAEEYMTNAGVIKDYSKALYKLAIELLVSHWYENREPISAGSVSRTMEFSLHSIIIQLAASQ